MKTIYLAHCYSDPDPAKAEANRKAAAEWACWIHSTFKVAVSCSWIVMTGGIAETAEARALGLEQDKALVAQCDEFWMVGPRISAGMAIERNYAILRNIPVQDFVCWDRTAPDSFRKYSRAAEDPR